VCAMLYVDNRIRMRETGVLINQKLLHFTPTVLRLRPAYSICLLAAGSCFWAPAWKWICSSVPGTSLIFHTTFYDLQRAFFVLNAENFVAELIVQLNQFVSAWILCNVRLCLLYMMFASSIFLKHANWPIDPFSEKISPLRQVAVTSWTSQTVVSKFLPQDLWHMTWVLMPWSSA